METLLRSLFRISLRRGFGGDRAWLLLALGAYVLRRVARSDDKVVLSMPINAGEQFAITLTDPDAPPE
jgi:hypothetical protein